jgi:hypothetical protein
VASDYESSSEKTAAEIRSGRVSEFFQHWVMGRLLFVGADSVGSLKTRETPSAMRAARHQMVRLRDKAERPFRAKPPSRVDHPQ